MKVHQYKWCKKNEDTIRFNEMSCYECSIDNKCIHYHLGEFKFLEPTIASTLLQSVDNQEKRVKKSKKSKRNSDLKKKATIKKQNKKVKPNNPLKKKRNPKRKSLIDVSNFIESKKTKLE